MVPRFNLTESKGGKIYELLPPYGERIRSKELEKRAWDENRISSATLYRWLERWEEEGIVKREKVSWKEVWYSRQERIEKIVQEYNIQAVKENLTWFLIDRWKEIIETLAQVAENYNKKNTDMQAQKYFQDQLEIRIIPMLRSHMNTFKPSNKDLSLGIQEAYRRTSIAMENLSMDIARTETVNKPAPVATTPEDKIRAEEFTTKQKALVDALHRKGQLTTVEKARKLIETLKDKEK